MLICTTESVPGKKVLKVEGFVKGTCVRTKSFGKDFGAGIKNLVGGEIDSYTELQEESRKIAISRLIKDAKRLNPEVNAILAIRITSTQITQGASEVSVYGTAVVLED
jgi:uncharacterized protein YbjQ (UPF0145 family)